jgi:hypothetical protein
LFVVAVVAFDGDSFARKILHVFDRAARDVSGRARVNEFESDSFPDPAAGSGDEGDFSI